MVLEQKGDNLLHIKPIRLVGPPRVINLRKGAVHRNGLLSRQTTTAQGTMKAETAAVMAGETSRKQPRLRPLAAHHCGT